MSKFDIDINGYWHITIYCNCVLDNGVLGFTKTNMDKKLSIVCIGKTFVFEDFFDTLIHEFKHVQSHICKYYNIPEDGEQAAYLIGYITRNFFKQFKFLKYKQIQNNLNN